MSFKSEYLERGQVAEITPGKHKNVVTSKIPLVLNILLGRKRCSCEQINNITGYFREDEQLPRRLNNVVRTFAHLRIFLVTSLVYHTNPYTPNRPLAARHSRGTNVLSQCDFCSPAWLFCTTWMASCKGPILYGGPQLSQQNQKPHGKNKIPHGKTKYFTAKAKELWFCCGYLLLPLFGCRNRVGLW